MITEVQTRKGRDAMTSDQWHVIHSRFTFPGARRPYLRSIHSEWGDQKACRAAARKLRAELLLGSKGVPVAERDEVFVRRPNFKSLKLAKAAPEKA